MSAESKSPSEPYDSTPDTLQHIRRVQELLADLCLQFAERGIVHDASKLKSPEKDLFDRMTPRLKDLEYGSEEYRAALAELKPALDHHYANNSHHPEHYRWHCPICKSQFNGDTFRFSPQGPNDTGIRYCPKCSYVGVIYESELMLKPELGINGMSLLDLVEMFVDWKAASERHASGNVEKSIQINSKRFGMSPQLTAIFENTRLELGW